MRWPRASTSGRAGRPSCVCAGWLHTRPENAESRSAARVAAERCRRIGSILTLMFVLRAHALALERDDFFSNRHLALFFCLSMIFSENRYPLFRIMLLANLGQKFLDQR